METACFKSEGATNHRCEIEILEIIEAEVGFSTDIVSNFCNNARPPGVRLLSRLRIKPLCLALIQKWPAATLLR